MRTKLLALVVLIGCSKHASETDAGAAPPASAATSLATAVATPPATVAASPVPPGSPPADGKYERVMVEGVTVPMIEVMDHGATVLVDTDGKKPRTWEEQYKRKRPALQPGEYDLHKTDANKNDKFEDDAIDREGRWVIDAKGNITKG